MVGHERSKPLCNRVDNYLRVSTSGYQVEELGDSSTQAIMDELKEAEAQLAVLHRRIRRLRELLAAAV